MSQDSIISTTQTQGQHQLTTNVLAAQTGAIPAYKRMSDIKITQRNHPISVPDNGCMHFDLNMGKIHMGNTKMGFSTPLFKRRY